MKSLNVILVVAVAAFVMLMFYEDGNFYEVDVSVPGIPQENDASRYGQNSQTSLKPKVGLYGGGTSGQTGTPRIGAGGGGGAAAPMIATIKGGGRCLVVNNMVHCVEVDAAGNVVSGPYVSRADGRP